MDKGRGLYEHVFQRREERKRKALSGEGPGGLAVEGRREGAAGEGPQWPGEGPASSVGEGPNASAGEVLRSGADGPWR